MEPGPDLSILDDLEIELRDVEHALKRLQDGSYGTCEVCGDPITESRLVDHPATRVCCDDHPPSAGMRNQADRA
jgi:RNA polymerase-binding transcription factor DksA